MSPKPVVLRCTVGTRIPLGPGRSFVVLRPVGQEGPLSPEDNRVILVHRDLPDYAAGDLVDVVIVSAIPDEEVEAATDRVWERVQAGIASDHGGGAVTVGPGDLRPEDYAPCERCGRQTVLTLRRALCSECRADDLEASRAGTPA